MGVHETSGVVALLDAAKMLLESGARDRDAVANKLREVAAENVDLRKQAAGRELDAALSRLAPETSNVGDGRQACTHEMAWEPAIGPMGGFVCAMCGLTAWASEGASNVFLEAARCRARNADLEAKLGFEQLRAKSLKDQLDEVTAAKKVRKAKRQP